MLDKEILAQLKDVFSKLENSIELVYQKSNHEKQDELLSYLEGVASTSEKISLIADNEESDAPSFKITRNGVDSGISILGIPGGHEFSSLIIAILNADGKGKFPDDNIQARIKALKGPIHLRTFISLSCENCPEVVQALNMMALVHDDFTHQMIDGAYRQEEIESLKIQGVPSVLDKNKLVSAGKIELSDLIEKLEKHYGKNEKQGQNQDLGICDVAVIGAGPGGASAAIYSARKGLKTVVIADKIGGQVQDTKGIENLISVPYIEGPQLSNHLTEHMSQYDISLYEHRRVQNIENGEYKTLYLTSGEFIKAKSIIVATGAKWRKLGVHGEGEYIGRGVAYCPHCDGPYYKGKDVIVVGGGNSGVEAAIDLAGIVKSVTVLEFADTFKADQVLLDKLNSLANVKTISNAMTTEVVGDGEKVISLKYKDRETELEHELPIDGVFVQIGLVPNSEFIKDLVETNKFGEIVVDGKGKTSIDGIYAAGDVTTTPFKQIIISMGEGAKAALSVFEKLMVA